jgi:hypothetical protein
VFYVYINKKIDMNTVSLLALRLGCGIELRDAVFPSPGI